ncbi:glycosyltransferase [Synechococcus sp. MIT S9451]|uniref:glycosyltransferase n=1 Tax=Synechococcus sp. MIT S9451 TaxID=3082543 RepID=UPI0039B63D38
MTISPDIAPFRSLSTFTLWGRLSRTQCTKLLKNSDVLLFPSLFESLGLPLLEAAQLSKPVICPDLDYSRELLGDSPYYYDSSQPIDSLISVIKNISSSSTLSAAKLVKSSLSTATAWDEFKLRLAL